MLDLCELLARRPRQAGTGGALCFGALLVMCSALAFGPRTVRAADLPEVYLGVKPSVVYIVGTLGDGIESGSGFVYASGDAFSLILTANHVVERAAKIDVIFDNDSRHRYRATVVRHDHVRDIAELSVALGRRVALKLQAAGDIREGMNVAEVGYPRAARSFEKVMGDQLRPSVHSGIVSAIRLNGELIQFDAATDHGDSGGPVIDTKSGNVVGLVRGELSGLSDFGLGFEPLPGSNFAASAPAIAAMLAGEPKSTRGVKAANDGMALAESRLASATSALAVANSNMASARAAVASAHGGSSGEHNSLAGTSSSAEYRVGFATPHYDDPMLDALAADLSARVAKHFANGNEVFIVPVSTGIAEASNVVLAGYCDDTRLNAVITPHVRLSRAEPAAGERSAGGKTYVTLDLRVTDCSGRPFFFAESRTRQAIAFASRSRDRDIVDMLDGMMDKIDGEFDDFKKVQAAGWKNLLKTGFASKPDRQYYSLIDFEKNSQSNAFSITTVYAGGPGAEAGLLPGDTIVAINGIPTTGSSTDVIWPSLNFRTYKMSVLRPGGVRVIEVKTKTYPELQATLFR